MSESAVVQDKLARIALQPAWKRGRSNQASAHTLGCGQTACMLFESVGAEQLRSDGTFAHPGVQVYFQRYPNAANGGRTRPLGERANLECSAIGTSGWPLYHVQPLAA